MSTSTEFTEEDARTMGSEAKKAGKHCVPIHDADFFKKYSDFTKCRPMGAGIPLLKAWNDGWTKEHIANF